jgi:hypothetical protein
LTYNSGYHGAFSRTFLSHDGISAITEPFHELFFHTMEFWLSWSLFTNFSFAQWNFGYHKAPSHTIPTIMEPFRELFFHTMEFRLSWSLFTNFSFTRSNFGYHKAPSHTILAITEPFRELFFHTMEFRLSRCLFTNFFFTRWNFGYHGAFSRTFLSHDGISAMTEPFHTMKFTKSTNCEKVNVFVPETTCRFMVRFFIIL